MTSSLFAQTGKIIDPGDGSLASQSGDHQREPNALWLDLRMSSQVDDNALSDNLNRRADAITVLEPHLKWSGSRSQMDWFLDYGNGFAFSHPLEVYTSQSHSLDGLFRLRVSRRLQLVLTNTFLDTRDPFASLSTSGSSTTGVANQTNVSIFPGSERTFEQAGGDLAYAVSRRASVGVSGSFLSLKYLSDGAAPVLPQFQDQGHSIGGRLFYAYHLSPHQWSGFEYQAQRMNFATTSTVDSFYYTHKLALSTVQTLSLYVGAQRSHTDGFADAGQATAELGRPAAAAWNWAAGAASTWASAAGRVQIGFSRKTDSSIALPGAALITGVTADLRHALGRSLNVEAAAAYDHENDLSFPHTKVSVVSLNAGIIRSMTSRISVAVRYWRIDEATESAIVRSFVADDNRVSVSAAYAFRLAH